MDHFKEHKEDILAAFKNSIVFAPMLVSITTSYVIVAKNIDIGPLEIVLWTALIFAGTVQIAVLNAYAGGAGLLELILLAFMTGLRLGFVSMSIFTYVRGIRKKLLPLFSFFIVDPAAGVIPARAKEGGNLPVFSFSFLIFIWLQWVFYGCLVVLLGAFIPEAWEPAFSFAMPAIFIGLTLSMIQDNFLYGIIVIAIAAPISLLLTFLFTPQLSSIIAAIFAALVGALIEERGGVAND